MQTKTQQMLAFLQAGELKQAFKLAKTFKIGFSKQEQKTVQLGYECLVHPSYYQQLGRNCEQQIQLAKELLTTKYMEQLI